MQQEPTIASKRLTAAVAAMALAVPFGGVAQAGDQSNGKGGERPQTAPGQEKKAENAAPQSSHSASGNGYGAGKSEKPAKPAEKTKPAKKPKPAKPAKPAKKTKPAKPAPEPAKPANPHAKAGKITICHATGSATNPYVQITISKNAEKAHARHHDGRDIIPAPAGGCPDGEDKAAAPAKAHGDRGQAKVTICHATGSATNPYVKITIAEPAVEAHRRHQDGRDIIPAPEGDCPATAAAAPQAERAALGGPAATLGGAALLTPAATGGEASLNAPKGGVLGEFASGGGGAPASAVAGDSVRRESGAGGATSSGSLPFTGLDAWVLVALGLGALLAGVAMRRAATRRPTA